MRPAFHLSIPVRSTRETADFFVHALGATVTHRDPGHVNVDFYGTQLTLQERPDAKAADRDLHFGVNLALEEFERVAARVAQSAPQALISRPTVVDAGTPMERKKLYLREPSGYLIELKGYRG